MIDWPTAIQQKRQQLVLAMVQAREQGRDQIEQALITVIGQLGEFETEFQKRIQRDDAEQTVIAQLAVEVRKRWPELWADMASSLASGDPTAWLEHSYLVVGVIAEHVQGKGHDQVSFESRLNQLDALPLSQETIAAIDSIIDILWESLQPHVEGTKGTMQHWEYAARMHLLSKRFLALYNKVQIDAITAVRKAEEMNELTNIGNNDA
jgi:hypothetical protein